MPEEESEEKFSISTAITKGIKVKQEAYPHHHHEGNEYVAKHLLKYLKNKLKERKSTKTLENYDIYETEFKLLKEQYKKRQGERHVHLCYTLWLSLQVAMSLTDQDKRK